MFACSVGSVCGTWYCMVHVYVGSALRQEQSQILFFSGPLVYTHFYNDGSHAEGKKSQVPKF